MPFCWDSTVETKRVVQLKRVVPPQHCQPLSCTDTSLLWGPLGTPHAALECLNLSWYNPDGNSGVIDASMCARKHTTPTCHR